MKIIWIILCLLVAACGPVATNAPPAAQPSVNAPTAAPTPASGNVTRADDAIALAQQKFPELRSIKQSPPNSIGASTNIWVIDQPDGWNLVFWKGEGDCPAGCINNHYWYVGVSKSGDAALAGEYVREFNSGANALQTRGQPMWGIPKQ